jgi:anti-sigma regulatory factor (Ser/Thr protein kinase)
MERVAEADLPSDRTAPRVARAVATEVAGEADDFLIVVSELVTNAVDHGDAPLHLRVRHDPDDGALAVEVTDSARRVPALASPGPSEERGRGLRIVDAIATQWGVTFDRQHKTVWAALDAD